MLGKADIVVGTGDIGSSLNQDARREAKRQSRSDTVSLAFAESSLLGVVVVERNLQLWPVDFLCRRKHLVAFYRCFVNVHCHRQIDRVVQAVNRLLAELKCRSRMSLHHRIYQNLVKWYLDVQLPKARKTS